MRSIPFLLFLVVGGGCVVGFSPRSGRQLQNAQHHQRATSSSRSRSRPLYAIVVKKPTFNKATQKWERASNDNGEYPYDAVGALLRHGPAPFFTRILNPDEYEQGILKYMATASVSRAEATGNMDAKINNGPDWAFQKMAEKKGAPKVDYTVLKKKDAALVIVWALFITPLTISVIYKTVSQF